MWCVVQPQGLATGLRLGDDRRDQPEDRHVVVGGEPADPLDVMLVDPEHMPRRRSRPSARGSAPCGRRTHPPRPGGSMPRFADQFRSRSPVTSGPRPAPRSPASTTPRSAWRYRSEGKNRLRINTVNSSESQERRASSRQSSGPSSSLNSAILAFGCPASVMWQTTTAAGFAPARRARRSSVKVKGGGVPGTARLYAFTPSRRSTSAGSNPNFNWLSPSPSTPHSGAVRVARSAAKRVPAPGSAPGRRPEPPPRPRRSRPARASRAVPAGAARQA